MNENSIETNINAELMHSFTPNNPGKVVVTIFEAAFEYMLKEIINDEASRGDNSPLVFGESIIRHALEVSHV